jgi:hypothetical protein
VDRDKERERTTNKVLSPIFHSLHHEFCAYKGLTKSLQTIHTIGKTTWIRLYAFRSTTSKADTESAWYGTHYGRREGFERVE